MEIIGDIENSSDLPPSSFINDLTTKMADVLTKTSAQTNESSAVHIGIKLNHNNYGLWSQVIEMYIAGKDKLGYIKGEFPQPPQTDPSFRKWRQTMRLSKDG